MKCKVEFLGSSHQSLEISRGSNLADELTAQNSPVLFGCRTGICGTCLIKVHNQSPDALLPRSEIESEFLETMLPGCSEYRLACQIHINTNICIEKADL